MESATKDAICATPYTNEMLPNEILVMIFSWLREKGKTKYHQWSLEKHIWLFVAARVCCTWRDAIYALAPATTSLKIKARKLLGGFLTMGNGDNGTQWMASLFRSEDHMASFTKYGVLIHELKTAIINNDPVGTERIARTADAMRAEPTLELVHLSPHMLDVWYRGLLCAIRNNNLQCAKIILDSAFNVGRPYGEQSPPLTRGQSSSIWSILDSGRICHLEWELWTRPTDHAFLKHFVKHEKRNFQPCHLIGIVKSSGTLDRVEFLEPYLSFGVLEFQELEALAADEGLVALFEWADDAFFHSIRTCVPLIRAIKANQLGVVRWIMANGHCRIFCGYFDLHVPEDVKVDMQCLRTLSDLGLLPVSKMEQALRPSGIACLESDAADWIRESIATLNAS